jgi:hypothetical protein
MIARAWVVVVLGCASGSQPQPKSRPPEATPAVLEAPPAQKQADPDRPAAITDEVAATFEQLVVVTQKAAADAVAANGDCKKATIAARANMPGIVAATRASKKHFRALSGDTAAMEYIKTRYKARAEEPTATLKRIAESCIHDPDFRAVIEEQAAGNKAP